MPVKPPNGVTLANQFSTTSFKPFTVAVVGMLVVAGLGMATSARNFTVT